MKWFGDSQPSFPHLCISTGSKLQQLRTDAYLDLSCYHVSSASLISCDAPHPCTIWAYDVCNTYTHYLTQAPMECLNLYLKG